MPTNWKFDPLTSLVTVILVPLGLFLGKLIVKNLKDWTQYALDGILYHLGKKFKLSIASRLTMRHYCNLMLRGQSKTLPVPSKRDVVLDTDSVFVPLRLEEATSGSEDLSHKTILDVGSRLRIVGDPGSGKSSLIKKIFRDACYAAINGSKGARLPILIELRDLRIPDTIESESTWLLDELRRRVSRAAVYRMSDCFETYSQTDGLLVLLDGLDEVATQRYPVVVRLIDELAEALAHLSPRNTIVLTLRTHFHQQVRGTLHVHFPHAAYVKPFTPTDIYDFLTRWPKRTDMREIVQIYRDLMDRPTLREMCTNPLVLAMYVADYQATGETLIPDTRTEFYSSVTEELLIKRRLRQTGTTAAKSTLRDLRERILGSIALAHLLNQEQPTNSIPWEFCVNVASRAADVPAAQTEELLREIGKETGLITEERAGESIRFIHLTFCEFLAAKQAVQGEEDGWSVLIAHHADFRSRSESWLNARLVEPIAFGAGLTPRSKRVQAVDDVLALADPRLTIRAFLETKLYNHPGWSRFIYDEMARLSQQPTEALDADWLYGVHLFNVVVRDAKFAAQYMHVRMEDDLVDQFVHGIRERGESALSTLFSALATHDAAAALRLSESAGFDLVQQMPELVIRCSDQAPFFAMIQDRATQDPNEHDRIAQLITEAALRSPVVRSLVRQDLLPTARKLLTSGSQLQRTIRAYPVEAEYAALIALVVDRRKQGQRVAELPLLNMLDQLPNPSRYNWLKFLDRAGLGFVMLLMVGMVLLIVHSTMKGPTDLDTLLGIPGWVLVTIMSFAAVISSLAYTNVRLAYQYLLYGSGPRFREIDFEISPPTLPMDSADSAGKRHVVGLRRFRTSIVLAINAAMRAMVPDSPQALLRVLLLPPRLRAGLADMVSARSTFATLSSSDASLHPYR
jgi:hypothetical protein